MWIIEGRSGKSLVLDDLVKRLNKNKRKVVILDSVGLKWANFSDNVNHFIIDNPSMEDLTDYHKYKEFLVEYDWVAFSVNAPKEGMELFKEFDMLHEQTVIVTIQNNKIESPIIYYV